MGSVESAGWLGVAKAKTIKRADLDTEVWLGQEDAAKLLKTSPRQLQRRAQQGVIAKRYLPKSKSEKTARVVYSRSDIQSLLERGPLDDSEQALLWVDKDEAAAFLGIKKPTLDFHVRDGSVEKKIENNCVFFKMADLIALKEKRSVRVVTAVPEGGVRLQPIPPAVSNEGGESTALARTGQSSDPFGQLAVHLARLAAAFPSAPPKPWLTLKEAAAYSGLPAAYLVRRAVDCLVRRAVQDACDDSFAINVGTDKQARWRFNREALGKGL